MGIRGELFSTKYSNERRSYFFNVKENRKGDVYLNIVESKKSEGSSEYERHQVVVFEEDYERFLRELEKATDFIKSNKK